MRLIALTATFFVAAQACAAQQKVAALLASDSNHYRQAFEGFQEEWGSTIPFTFVGHELPQAEVVVAFGSRASLAPWPDETLLVTCLAPGAKPHRSKNILTVDLLPAPSVLIQRLKQLMPSLKSIRILWTSPYQIDDVTALSEAGVSESVTLLTQRLENPAKLPEFLRSFSTKTDALLLMPDPGLVNAENFLILSEYAKAAKVPFIAPTEGLANQGATASIAVPFRDVGRAAAVALKAKLRGERISGPVHPEGAIVTVNQSAAKIVGLDLRMATGLDRIIP